MAQRKADEGLDFEALRLGIERCDPDLVLGFYAEDARLSIVNAGAPQGPAFELRGKAEIAKHLRAIFGQGASHRVGGSEVASKKRMTFREACDYPDGDRVLIETTLEIIEGKIVDQVDVVARAARVDGEEEVDPIPPVRELRPNTLPGVGTPAHHSHSERSTEKEVPG